MVYLALFFLAIGYLCRLECELQGSRDTVQCCPQHLEQYLAQGRWVIHVFQMNESLKEQTGCMCSSKSCLSGWYTLSPHSCHNWERKESHFCGVYILVVEADFVSMYSLGEPGWSRQWTIQLLVLSQVIISQTSPTVGSVLGMESA